MEAQLVVPKEFDYHWMMRRATGGKAYDLNATEQDDGSILLVYDSFYDKALKRERDNYHSNYLQKIRPPTLKRIGEVGRDKALNNFSFFGQPLLLDFTTECRLDALCRFLDRNPEVTEVHWDKSGEGDFVTLLRDHGYALFDAASLHIQACFNRRKSLTDRVNSAVTIEDPVFTEIETGWPGDPESSPSPTPALAKPTGRKP